MASANNTVDKFARIHGYFITNYPEETYEITEQTHFKCRLIAEAPDQYSDLDGSKIRPSAPCSIEYVLKDKIAQKKLCNVELGYFFEPTSHQEILSLVSIVNYTSKRETDWNSNNTKGQEQKKGVGNLFLIIAIHKFLELIYQYMKDETNNGFKEKNSILLAELDDKRKDAVLRRITDTVSYYSDKSNMHDNIEIRLHPVAIYEGGVKTPKNSPQQSLVDYYKRIGFSDEYNKKKLFNDVLGASYTTLIDRYLEQLPHSGGFRKTNAKKIKSNKQILKKSKKIRKTNKK